MKEQLQQRLQELRVELDSGHKMLAELKSREDSLTNSLLRISGAIQVLEELLDQEPQLSQNNRKPENSKKQPVTQE